MLESFEGGLRRTEVASGKEIGGALANWLLKYGGRLRKEELHRHRKMVKENRRASVWPSQKKKESDTGSTHRARSHRSSRLHTVQSTSTASIATVLDTTPPTAIIETPAHHQQRADSECFDRREPADARVEDECARGNHGDATANATLRYLDSDDTTPYSALRTIRADTAAARFSPEPAEH